MPVVVPFPYRQDPASSAPVISAAARHSLGVTAYHLGDSAVRWRTINIRHALVQAGKDILWEQAHFVRLVQGKESDPAARELATVVAAQGSEVLVLGNSRFAAEIRERLTWARELSLLPLPGPTTPLTHLVHPLSRRTQNLVEQVGFSSVEELASVSQTCWYRLHGFGPKSAEELALVLHHERQQRPPRGTTARRNLIVSALKPRDIERHAQMINLLAASTLRVDIAAKVCERLALEDLPPTDPEIAALLDSADGDPALLERYLRTHQTPRWPEA